MISGARLASRRELLRVRVGELEPGGPRHPARWSFDPVDPDSAGHCATWPPSWFEQLCISGLRSLANSLGFAGDITKARPPLQITTNGPTSLFTIHTLMGQPNAFK
jgi:hypothetical protein